MNKKFINTKLIDKKEYGEKIVDIKEDIKKQYPCSFRFDKRTIESLHRITYLVNSKVSKKISTTRIMKALINIGKNLSEEWIIKALKEEDIY